MNHDLSMTIDIHQCFGSGRHAFQENLPTVPVSAGLSSMYYYPQRKLHEFIHHRIMDHGKDVMMTELRFWPRREMHLDSTTQETLDSQDGDKYKELVLYQSKHSDDKVSMSTHTYPHKSLRNINIVICNHQVHFTCGPFSRFSQDFKTHKKNLPCTNTDNWYFI